MVGSVATWSSSMSLLGVLDESAAGLCLKKLCLVVITILGPGVVVAASLASLAAFFLLARKGWTLLAGEANRDFLGFWVVGLALVLVV